MKHAVVLTVCSGHMTLVAQCGATGRAGQPLQGNQIARGAVRYVICSGYLRGCGSPAAYWNFAGGEAAYFLLSGSGKASVESWLTAKRDCVSCAAMSNASLKAASQITLQTAVCRPACTLIPRGNAQFRVIVGSGQYSDNEPGRVQLPEHWSWENKMSNERLRQGLSLCCLELEQQDVPEPDADCSR